MKKLAFILLAVSALAGNCPAFAKVCTNLKPDSLTSVTREVAGFDAIHIQGPFEVYITQGTTESLKFDAPAEILSRIVTEVHGSTLEIHNKHDDWGWGEKSWYSDKGWWRKHPGKIKVWVTAKKLNSLKLSGSGGAFFNEGITANSLKLQVRGSGGISGKVAVKDLDSHISGSGHINLSGTADYSAVRLAGSAHFEAQFLVTSNYKLRVSGSGAARINASNSIVAALSGSGNVSYTGDARIVTTAKSGSGSISRF